MSEATKESTPKELEIHKKWDQIIDLGLRRTVTGFAFGFAAGIMFFRGLGPRAGMTGFGTGFGMGSAYSDAQRELADVFPQAVEANPEFLRKARGEKDIHQPR